jgi:hypothetical protein
VTAGQTGGGHVVGYAALDASLDALPAQERAEDLSAWDTAYRHSPADRYPDLTAVAGELTAVGDPANFRLAIDLHIEAIRSRVEAGPAPA